MPAQDAAIAITSCMRVWASSGAASFRRRPTLEQCLLEAQTQV
jgi:hypothetical protein